MFETVLGRLRALAQAEGFDPQPGTVIDGELRAYAAGIALVYDQLTAARAGDFADDRNLHVGELHVDRGVVDIAALLDLFGDGLGQLAAGLSRAFDLADHGHVEHPFLVDGAHLERLRACCAGDVGSRERVVGGCRVERHCQFGVLAVDDDRQPVERLDADLSVFGDLFGREGLGVLQIPDAFLCGARNEQNAEDRCPDEKAELLHVLVRR